MQLAAVAALSPVLQPREDAVASVGVPLDAPRTSIGFGPVAPAAAGAPLGVEGAVDGVARLAAVPIVDFPGIVAGDVFDIVKGSKAGPIGVRGEAVVNRLDPDHANFHVIAGRFGMKIDVEVDIEQIGPDQVRISSRGQGIPDTVAIGRVVEARTNHAVFEQIDDPSRRTTIDHDGHGTITIDAAIPTFGSAHLILEKR